MRRYLTLAALIFSSSFALANPVMPTPPAKSFDCGNLNQAQAEAMEKELSSQSLKDVARTCEEQAVTFQTIAQQARESLSQKDVSDLYAKAANAQMYVANFTNTALFK